VVRARACGVCVCVCVTHSMQSVVHLGRCVAHRASITAVVEQSGHVRCQGECAWSCNALVG
jgi:hypothetical protein